MSRDGRAVGQVEGEFLGCTSRVERWRCTVCGLEFGQEWAPGAMVGAGDKQGAACVVVLGGRTFAP